ncbi:NAD(P)H-dependent oxidoreductase [Companilactobacillus zhachilii]|uniref:FMN-dependent NADH-azoreductase n=1 Tax=Companilactobacillus zhachilii TaxID=2304606 RepID=UPI001924D085|nr:NAD(P)H-dependent oxidoreductase [Companilactobacillus zhachilii]MBL3530720.1 NAD(P)H-dependent oxidoreductase [Companilactobacillus zhachilii]
MSKVLVIYAHPETAKGSSTHELYKHFINSYTAKNPNDEIIVHNISEYMPFRLDKLAISIYNKNLAKSDLTPDEIRLSESRDKWLDEFIHADKYVFANPMYNLFIPAEMKRYIDMIMQAGKTFHYDDKGLSVGDLHGKKAIHLQSSGGNYHNDLIQNDAMIYDLGDQYLQTTLHMMGVDDYSAVFAEGMDKDPMHTIEILDNAYAKAELAGKEF